MMLCSVVSREEGYKLMKNGTTAEFAGMHLYPLGGEYGGE